jgi:hypothetical protein
MERIYNITSQFATDFGIHINAKKCAYAWTNDEPYGNPKYKGQSIELIGEEGTYKYLGINMNMKLDFSKHLGIITGKYKSVISAIMKIQGVDVKFRIQLINAAASAMLTYTMGCIIIPEKSLQKLNTWTAKQIKRSMKAHVASSTRFFYTHMGLWELTNLNKYTYINTQVTRTLNKLDALPRTQLIKDNENLPEFLNGSERALYASKFIKQGGYVPVSLVLYKSGFELIKTKQNNLAVNHKSDFQDASYKGIAGIIRQLTNANINYWEQLTKKDLTVMTLEEVLDAFYLQVPMPDFKKLFITKHQPLCKGIISVWNFGASESVENTCPLQGSNP